MKKVTLIILINLALVSHSFSYTAITDPDLFYSFFENPTKIIDFTELKDGTSFNNISKTFELHISKASELDCISSRAENFNALTVRSSAFSNTWYFQGAESVQTHGFCNAVLWFDQGISTGDHNLAVSIKTERSKPFAIYTNKGFLGVIPDTPQETLFIFENLHLIFSFETEFTKTAPASESKASFLAQADIN